MIPTPDISYIAYTMMTVLAISMLLTFVRLVRGPTLADRVVALDLVSVLSVGMFGLYAIATDEPVFLRAATVVALVGYVGTVAFAYYLQKRAYE